jgi:hypothetical protein
MHSSVRPSSLWVLLVTGLIAASASTPLTAGQASMPSRSEAASKALVAQNYGKIPLSFEANQGQADKTVRFLSSGSGYSLFLTDSTAVLALTKPEVSNAKPHQTIADGIKATSALRPGKTDVVRMELADANRTIHVSGVDSLPGTANYFIGNDPSKWHGGVPTFGKVKYAGVYSGIDLVYYGNQRQLEYDFIVAPGASPKPIKLQFAGANKLDLTPDGDLTISAANGEIAFHKHVVYQVKDGLRQPIDGQFAMLSANTVGFTLGRFDRSKPLVIDPVLSYSTYLGGSLSDGAAAIAVDGSGNAYVTGSAYSTNFPVTTGAFQSTNKEPANYQCVFVSKLNPTGTALVYSTYLGGSGNTGNYLIYGDIGTGIAVDGSGDAYVTGLAESTNFPTTTGAFQTVNNSTLKYAQNAFVTKLNPAGTALVYSTYLGGNNQDTGTGIAVDIPGYAYVTGYTSSSTFPVTTGAYQVTNNSDLTDGWSNAFITKLNTTGKALVYSTYLGGSSYGARGAGIAVDSSGYAYVTGSAASTDFPTTTGAFQTTNKAAVAAGPDTVAYNVFVTRLNSTGTALEYSTFLGGSVDDYGAGIAQDGSGNAYVTGTAWSSDFPVAGSAFQSANNGYANQAFNAFVTEVNSAGTGLVYSTFLGGTGIPPQNDNESGSGDNGEAIAVDGLGDAYVTGSATSTNFPTTSGAYQTVNNAAGLLQSTGTIGVNAFITKLNPAGSALLYSTYFGGSTQDEGYGIALDGVGGVYVAGGATSTNFPITTGAYQTANGGDEDAFIAKLAIGSVPTTIATTTTLTSSANPQVQGVSITFTATVKPASGTGVPTGNVVFSVDGTSASTVALNGSGEAAYMTSSLTTGSHTILASYAGSSTYSASSQSLTETITAPPAATTTILTSSASSADEGASVTFTATVTSAASGTPTGSVTFYDGTTTLGTGTLSGNTATFATTSLPAGSNSITATYSGDANFATSTSAPLIEVVAAPYKSILWRNSSTGEVKIWFMNGTTIASQGVVGTIAPPWNIVGIGDFNGDGKADLLWQNSSTGELEVWLMNGATKTGSGSPGTVGSPWKVAGVGDFNGDGKSDILWRNSTTGEVKIWFMNGIAIASQGIVGTIAPPWNIVGVGDFNGDGKADLLWQNSSTGEVQVWLMNGITKTSSGSPGTVTSPWEVAGAGDFNGDGKTDILWRDSTTGEVKIWFMNGTAMASQGVVGTIAPPWNMVGAADFNGDGKSDLLWQNSSTGEVEVWLMNGITKTSSGSPGTVTSPWAIVPLLFP